MKYYDKQFKIDAVHYYLEHKNWDCTAVHQILVSASTKLMEKEISQTGNIECRGSGKLFI